MQKTIQLVSVILALATQITAHAKNDEEGLPNSHQSFTAEEIPSALWPPFIKSTQEILYHDGTSTIKIKPETRGVFHRAEGNTLIIDFGRNGIVEASPDQTDFYERVSQLKLGQAEKEFPNFALQLGNKLMDFGRGKKSGAIRFSEVKDTEIYILLYINQTYTPDLGPSLMAFDAVYDEVEEAYPQVEVIMMPRDREFYNFAFTTGFSPAFIAPHVRLGYIDSFRHDAFNTPLFVAVDANGRILSKTESPPAWSDLGKELQRVLSELKIDSTN